MGVQCLGIGRAGDGKKLSLKSLRHSGLTERAVHLGQPQVQIGMRVHRDPTEQVASPPPIAPRKRQIGQALDAGPVAWLHLERLLVKRGSRRFTFSGAHELNLRELGQAPRERLRARGGAGELDASVVERVIRGLWRIHHRQRPAASHFAFMKRSPSV